MERESVWGQLGTGRHGVNTQHRTLKALYPDTFIPASWPYTWLEAGDRGHAPSTTLSDDGSTATRARTTTTAPLSVSGTQTDALREWRGRPQARMYVCEASEGVRAASDVQVEREHERRGSHDAVACVARRVTHQAPSQLVQRHLRRDQRRGRQQQQARVQTARRWVRRSRGPGGRSHRPRAWQGTVLREQVTERRRVQQRWRG